MAGYNDITRRGEREEPDPADRARFLAFMLEQHVGATHPIHEKDQCDALGLEGRTLRAIRLSIELAGECAFAGGDEGLFVPEYQEELDPKNDRDEAQAKTTLRAVAARKEWAKRLPRRQPGLW